MYVLENTKCTILKITTRAVLGEFFQNFKHISSHWKTETIMWLLFYDSDAITYRPPVCAWEFLVRLDICMFSLYLLQLEWSTFFWVFHFLVKLGNLCQFIMKHAEILSFHLRNQKLLKHKISTLFHAKLQILIFRRMHG